MLLLWPLSMRLDYWGRDAKIRLKLCATAGGGSTASATRGYDWREFCPFSQRARHGLFLWPPALAKPWSPPGPVGGLTRSVPLSVWSYSRSGNINTERRTTLGFSPRSPLFLLTGSLCFLLFIYIFLQASRKRLDWLIVLASRVLKDATWSPDLWSRYPHQQII